MKKLMVMSSIVSDIIAESYNTVVVTATEKPFDIYHDITDRKESGDCSYKSTDTVMINLDALCNSGCTDNYTIDEIKSVFVLSGILLTDYSATIFTIDPAKAETPKGKEIINILRETFGITPEYDKSYALAV